MVERLVDRILTNQGRYESVANALGILWYFVAVIQNMESSQDFEKPGSETVFSNDQVRNRSLTQFFGDTKHGVVAGLQPPTSAEA